VNGKNLGAILLSINPSDIKRGEIWRINFDPTVGNEIKKSRPAVVISSDAIGSLPLKIVAPITGWKDSFSNSIWHVKIEPDSKNNLTKTSSVDTLQVRGVDVKRFIPPQFGEVSQDQVEEIISALAAVVELE
jgi:mRNA interferase MazF